MRIKPLHSNFIKPSKSTESAGAYDIYMPEEGCIEPGQVIKVPLGFAAEVPEWYVALILPRSSSGAKHGLELNNSVGVVDADYRGQWFAFLRTKDGEPFYWDKGERILQFLIVPVMSVTFEVVDELNDTVRGTGGFGSTGK